MEDMDPIGEDEDDAEMAFAGRRSPPARSNLLILRAFQEVFIPPILVSFLWLVNYGAIKNVVRRYLH